MRIHIGAHLTMAVRVSLGISVGLITALLSVSQSPMCLAFENRARDAAKQEMAAHNFDTAINKLNEAIGLDGTDPENYMMRGRCYFRLSNYALSIDDFNKVTEMSPNLFTPLVWRGTAHAKLGQDDLALKDYAQAIKLNPRLAERYFAKGTAQPFHLPGISAEHAKNSAAVKDYKDAMKQVYPNGYSTQATAKDASDDEDANYLTDMAAGAEFEKGVPAQSPTTASAGKQARKVATFDQDPDFDETGAVPGSQPLKGDAEIVVQRCSEAIRQDKRNPEYFYLRAKAFQKLGKVDAAYRDYAEAINLDPGVTKFFIGRASMFNQLGKPLLVDADVKKARSLDHDLPKKIQFGGDRYADTVRWSGDGPDAN